MNEHNDRNENFVKIKYYYDHGFWTQKQVLKATKYPKNNPWITKWQYELIVGIGED